MKPNVIVFFTEDVYKRQPQGRAWAEPCEFPDPFHTGPWNSGGVSELDGAGKGMAEEFIKLGGRTWITNIAQDRILRGKTGSA